MPGRLANPLHGPWPLGAPLEVGEAEHVREDNEEDDGSFLGLEKAFAKSFDDGDPSDDDVDDEGAHAVLGSH